MTRRSWTALERARLCSLRASGSSVSQCAAILARPLGSVSRALHRAGLCKPLTYSRRKRGALTRSVLDLRTRGKGVTEIADILGVCRATVYEVIDRGKSE